MSDTLVSVGLPVRNGADRIGDVVRSVFAQDHPNLELVICDNASTDGTEDVCRELVENHHRIVYHRHPVNVGVLNNYISALRLATGTFFRWVGETIGSHRPASHGAWLRSRRTTGSCW